ncbi:MAG: VanZ family protein [Acidobacteria bacterium]|nr:VanZ family protein [Acidobacteriota bacterium]
MQQSVLIESQDERSLPEAVHLLAKYGFYFSLAAYFYAVMFPFHIDLSRQQLWHAWSQAILIPFWDANRGVHISGDDLANILFAMPFGFFGFLFITAEKKKWVLAQWFLYGMALGFAAELIQLAVPTRATVVTDSINNGMGAFLGAIFAFVKGRAILEFLTGAATERRNIYLWLLIWSMVAMVGPYDVSQDFFADFGIGHPAPAVYPQESGTLDRGEWLQMAGFALIGALAVRLAVPGRRKSTLGQPLSAAALVIVFPAVLQFARLLVESRAPVLDDMALDIFAALAGAFASLFISPAMQAFSGFILFKAALVVSGLSPFYGWRLAGGFQWIPFYEFCTSRAPAALYETVLCFSSFAILGGLLQLSFPQFRRRYVALYALAFAGVIEFCQTFLPAHSAGITDIIMAALGAWTGAHICAAVETARLNQRLFVPQAHQS